MIQEDLKLLRLKEEDRPTSEREESGDEGSVWLTPPLGDINFLTVVTLLLYRNSNTSVIVHSTRTLKYKSNTYMLTLIVTNQEKHSML